MTLSTMKVTIISLSFLQNKSKYNYITHLIYCIIGGISIVFLVVCVSIVLVVVFLYCIDWYISIILLVVWLLYFSVYLYRTSDSVSLSYCCWCAYRAWCVSIVSMAVCLYYIVLLLYHSVSFGMFSMSLSVTVSLCCIYDCVSLYCIVDGVFIV